MTASANRSTTSADTASGQGATDELLAGRTREVLRRLELDVTQRLDGLLHGDHRGLVPGQGTELGEPRRYAPGDDVRRIDWNVTARLSETYIRQTIAERELETWLVIDRSPRLDFGSARHEKRELVLAAAAATGFLTNRDGNRIGAMLAGRGDPTILPAKGSRKHLLRILHEIAAAPRGDGAGVTDLGAALSQLGSVAKRRGLIVVVSDFRVAEGWETPLRILTNKHDVLAVEVIDPLELALPNVGPLPITDPATGEIREIPTQKQRVRDAYAAAAEARRDQLIETFRSNRVDHLTLHTDAEWLDDLVRFVGARRHRIAALAGGRR